MRLVKAAVFIAAGAIAAAVSYTPVTAQTQMTYSPRYAGAVGSSVANCPNIAWRIGRSPTGSLHGMMWYTDMSGMSEVNGTESGDHFNLTLKSVMGNGPVGTVQGVRGKGAKLTGEGCANATFKPVVLNTYGGTG
jgi:hypothetical protein